MDSREVPLSPGHTRAVLMSRHNGTYLPGATEGLQEAPTGLSAGFTMALGEIHFFVPIRLCGIKY